ncbi:MAG: TRAP transporter small permease [Gammaproteobacteria bacterium]|nr:TRAP transporter small permease [Gammaproteobacteria bacterium]MCB1852292.1 TRAP transporter small permease [Gammaproteobacteria bacterium]MCP5417084.1 TRAP transporter small permease [Chromatiaceae bacterium]
MEPGVRERLARFSATLNWFLERFCALLVALMVLDIWFGIIARYLLELGLTWTEELARYLMIWAALVAVPCAAYHREHIGLTIVSDCLPRLPRIALHLALDLLGIAFFLFLFVYGLRMTADGPNQYAMIFGLTMTLPYAAVPVSAGLTVWQILVAMIRDRGDWHGRLKEAGQ